jgi:hypothetical protein
MGAVLKHSSDWNIGREAALSSGLSPLTPGITLQRACGTSLDTVITVANKIALGRSSRRRRRLGHHLRRADRGRQAAAPAPARRQHGQVRRPAPVGAEGLLGCAS